MGNYTNTRYVFKNEKLHEIKSKYRLRSIAKRCGITENYLSLVLNNKVTCKKPVAYIFVKTLDNKNKIEDYFNKTTDNT